jgi:spore coat polysaccharide biosynthesis protein SpsF
MRMVERVQSADLVGSVVVATTTDRDDNPIEACCRAARCECFRGHPTDLLDRHYIAALQHGADVVVKIPSDCPLIDPRIIDRVVGVYLKDPDAYDYVSNLHPPSYPDGNDVEVMSMHALEIAWREATRGFEREHTTPYFWENPGRFRLQNVEWETGMDLSMTHRWTIDYQDDYQLIAAIYEELYPLDPSFGLEAILDLVKRRPDIAALNAHYAGVNWYRHHLGELRTVTAAETRPEPAQVALAAP